MLATIGLGNDIKTNLRGIFFLAFFPLMDYSAYKIHANTNTSHQTGSTLERHKNFG